MLYENEGHIVKTRWGSFRLDEAAYRDYLAGKLWIAWDPRPAQAEGAAREPPCPPNVSEEALRRRELAPKKGAYELLASLRPLDIPVPPYRARMSRVGIEEMNLSVRSSNCLMRAGANSFGKLWELLCGDGLRGIRNLGVRSEEEILRSFFDACYALLSPLEQALLWQETERESMTMDGRAAQIT